MPGKNPAPALKIDDSTLNGIYREGAPYSPSPYPFRFTSLDQLKHEALRNNLKVTYAETISRTYRSGQEYFEFIVAEATRNYRAVLWLTKNQAPFIFHGADA